MTAQKTVLVIEDDLEFQSILKTEITKLGQVVVVAKDLTEAAARVAFQDFDVIVTDVRLGKGSGLNFLVELKQKKKVLPHVVVMTGLEVSPEVRQKLTQILGVRKILEKPFNMSDFKTYMQNAA